MLSGLDAIAVDSRRSVPTYETGRDGYVHGGDELVAYRRPILGGWEPVADVRGDHRVERFRSRIEQSFQRFERWSHRPTGRVHWRRMDPGGGVSIFGVSGDGTTRIADPADPDQRTSEWLIEAEYDGLGNAIRYEYKAEDDAGVDGTLAYEAGRVLDGRSLTQRYIKRIFYGNTVPLSPDTPHDPANRWRFQVVFDYGEHATAAVPTPAEVRTWPVRADAFSSCHAGFEVRTRRLCRRVLMFHDFPALGGSRLVGATELTHAENQAAAVLERMTWRGYRTNLGTDAVEDRAIPHVELRYSSARPDDAFVQAEVTENLPIGIDGRRHQWIDLRGEGLPGILNTLQGGWFFKENLGDGRFGPLHPLDEAPARPSGGFSLHDFNGDGNIDLVGFEGREAGFFTRERGTGRWEGFQTFSSIPRVDFANARVQWIDLNGDGYPDLLIDRDDRLTWYASEGSEGFAAAVELAKPERRWGGVPTVEQDGRVHTFFADMNGDGRADLVDVDQGRVEYWPNLGHGRFGPPVTMENAPTIAAFNRLDADRLRFVDLDGSGTADLIYLGEGEIFIWTNQSGNQFSAARRIAGLPYIDDLASAQILDFFADGTSCLIWSTQLPGTEERAVQTLRLTGVVPPRLLLSVSNGVGRLTTLTYRSSARDYLRDKANGRSWTVPLPHHQTVVARSEATDQIGGGRLATWFEYHDGIWDNDLRRFNGFGFTDTFDADVIVPGGTIAPEQVAPPSVVRRWYYTGDAMGGDAARISEHYSGDALAPHLPPPHIEDIATHTTEEQVESLRAITGLPWREEVYEVLPDGSRAPHPLRVTETAYLIRRMQPGETAEKAVFSPIPIETLSCDYEGTATDPRIAHDVVLAVDADGQATRRVSLAYPRRPVAGILPEQQRLLATHASVRFSRVDDADHYETGVLIESQRQVLTGVAPAVAGLFSRAALLAQVDDALAHPLGVYAAAAHTARESRLVQWERTYFWNAAQTAALPHGTIGPRTLPHHSERACIPDAELNTAFDGKVTAAMMSGEGRYRLADGYWWAEDTIRLFADAAHFHILTGERMPGAGDRAYTHDAESFFVVSTTEGFANAIQTVVDLQSLGPARVTDPNGNVSETLYDVFGVPFASATSGTQRGSDGAVHPVGENGLAAWAPPGAITAAAIVANPAAILQGATRFLFHDLGAFARGEGPPLTIALERERHVHDGEGTAPAPSPIRVTIDYLDGFGRSIQTKTNAGSGPAIQRDGAGQIVLNPDGTPALAAAAARWHSSGHDVFNQKGLGVRQHEPFFTVTAAFENDATLRALGASTRFWFDAAGRNVREELPDGSFRTTSYSAWSTREMDENDNVAGSGWEATRQALPASDPERRALDQAQPHANTPSIVHLDPIGRACRRVETGIGGADRVTFTEYGAFDGPLRVVDPRGLTAFSYRYDLLGRAVFERSIDAGDHWTLFDSADRPVHRWDGRNVHVAFSHDAAGRRIETAVEDAPGAALRVVEQIVYGDNPLVADAQERNARGRVIEHRDEAGRVRIDRYDLKGQALDVFRAMRVDFRAAADWSGPAPALSADYRTTLRVDAFGRTLVQACADGTTREYLWAAYEHLSEIRLSTADGVLNRVVLATGVAHNARGQRAALRLGNGVDVSWQYDTRTARLRHFSAARGGPAPRTYLDLSYTYDPVGNITNVIDGVQDPASPAPLLQGLTVSASQDFTYDAFYRLRTASGRAHQALIAADDSNGPGSLKGTRHITLANGAAIERYTRTYQYDLSGNLRSVRHAGQTQNWTSNNWISPTSNRTLPDDGAPIAAPESWFDPAGNNIRLPHLREMVWNHANRLTRTTIIDRSAAGQPNDAEYYVHGADGRRVRRVTERLVSGQLEVVDTLYLDGCEIRRATLGAALRLARTTSFVDDGPARLATLHQWTADTTNVETASIADKKLHYLVGNHLGSVTLELDANGNVLTYEEYFPYGSTSFIAGDDLRDVRLKDTRYAGRLRDDATGFYHYEFREYAPWIGRWMSPDPAGPEDGPNLYLYVHANPIRFIDRDGLNGTDTQVRPTITHELPEGIRTQLDANPDLAARFDRNEVFFLPQEDGSYRAITRAEAEAWVREQNEAGNTPTLSLFSDAPPEPEPDPTEEEVEEIMQELEAALAQIGEIELPDLSNVGTGGAGLNAQDGNGDANAGTAHPADGSSGSGNAQDGETAESGSGGSATTGTGPGLGNNGGGAGAAGEGGGAQRDDTNTGATGGGDADKGNGPGGSGAGERRGAGGGTREGTGDVDRRGVQGGVENGVEGGRVGGTPGLPPVPPGYQLGPDGIPYSPDLPPPAGTGRPVTDPSQVRNGVAEGADDRGEPGSDRSGRARPGGVEGGREGGAEAREGQREGGSGDRPGSGEPASALDTATRWAGYLNFVFEEGEDGVRGGIPGGLGLLGLSGKFFQVLYIITTVVSTFFMVKTIIQSVSGAALRAGLRSLLNLLRNPGQIFRGLWNAGRGFIDEAAGALRWLRQSWRGRTGNVRWWHTISRIFRDARQWASAQSWRNGSFWFRPRWFGQSPFYNWEHTVTQAFGRRFPGLQPYINSYLNTFLRLPVGTNSWLGNNLARKAMFYAGAIEANIRSWRLGQWIGGQAAEELYREPDYATAD